MSEISKRRQKGLSTYKKIGWGDNPYMRNTDPQMWEFTTDFVFGDIWSRPGLSLRERELITLACLMSVGTEGMRTHMRHAETLGITDQQIKEVIYQTMVYLGIPKGIIAMKNLNHVIAEKKVAKKAAKKTAVKTAKPAGKAPRKPAK